MKTFRMLATLFLSLQCLLPNISNAIDSTGFFAPTTTSKPQKQGYTNQHENPADYSIGPAGTSSIPQPPKLCDKTEQVLYIEYGYPAAVSSTTSCASWGCPDPSDCGLFDIPCYAEKSYQYSVCNACKFGCATFVPGISCSCPYVSCTRTTTAYVWDKTHVNTKVPPMILNIICGTPNWVDSK